MAKSKVTQEQVEALLSQLEMVSKDILAKADKKNTQQQIEFLNEQMSQIQKSLITKAEVKDVLVMLDKKTNQDEIMLDINYIKNTIQKHMKTCKPSKEEHNHK